MGEAEDSRSQLLNKQTAFGRCVRTKEFQGWLKLKIEAGLGNVEIVELDDHGNEVTRKLSMNEV